MNLTSIFIVLDTSVPRSLLFDKDLWYLEVNISVVWLFEFLKNHQFWFFKYSIIKQPQGLIISKTSQKSTVSMKELSKNKQFSGRFYNIFIFCGIHYYIPKPVRSIFWEPASTQVYMPVDNLRLYVHNSKNL